MWGLAFLNFPCQSLIDCFKNIGCFRYVHIQGDKKVVGPALFVTVPFSQKSKIFPRALQQISFSVSWFPDGARYIATLTKNSVLLGRWWEGILDRQLKVSCHMANAIFLEIKFQHLPRFNIHIFFDSLVPLLRDQEWN